MPLGDQKRPSQTADKFLFVNTPTGPESNNLIRSRKSQVSLRERRHAAIRSLESRRKAIQPQVSATKSSVGWTSDRDWPLVHHEDPEEEPLDRKVWRGFKSDHGMKEQNLLHRIPMTICFPNDAVDPFNTTATGVDSWTHNVIQYYVYKMIPDALIAESRRFRPEPEQFNLAISARVHACLSSELHMYAMMASCSSRMRRFECVRSLNRRNSPEYCVARAVTVLRKKLSANLTTLDPSTFLDIVSLCSAETYMGNHEAAAIHLRLIEHLGREMGGFTKFDPYLMELFTIVDANLAIDADSAPILPLEVHEWRQDSVPAQRMAEVIHRAMTADLPPLEPGTLPGWTTDLFSPSLLTLVDDLTVYLQAAQYLWNQPHSMPEDRKWIFLRGSGIIHRLLSLKQRPDSASSPAPAREECCRIALLLLTHAVMCHVRARQFVKAWAPRFQASVLRSMGPGNRWHECPRIFLWVLNMGLFIAEGTEEEEWFVGEAARAATRCGVSVGDAYASFTRTLFMLDERVREDVLKVVGVLEGEQGRLPIGWTV